MLLVRLFTSFINWLIALFVYRSQNSEINYHDSDFDEEEYVHRLMKQYELDNSMNPNNWMDPKYKPIKFVPRRFRGSEDEFEDFLEDICETTTDSNGNPIIYINFATLEQLGGGRSYDYCEFIQKEAYAETGQFSLITYYHTTVPAIGTQLQWNDDTMVLCNIEDIDQALYWLESKTRQYYMN